MKIEISAHKPLFVHDGYQMVQIRMEDIVSVAADGSYCTLTLVRRERSERSGSDVSPQAVQIALSIPMGNVVLPEEMFVRVSRSAIVNIWHVRKKTGSRLTMVTGEVVKMGETYQHALDDKIVVLGVRKAK